MMLLQHEENLRKQRRFIIDARFAQGSTDIYDFLKCVEYVLENLRQSE